jgi:hypothetical protein
MKLELRLNQIKRMTGRRDNIASRDITRKCRLIQNESRKE